MKNYDLFLFYSVGFSLAVEFEWKPSDANKNLTKLFLDSDGFYVGGLNTTYFINYDFKGKTIIFRIIVIWIFQMSHNDLTVKHLRDIRAVLSHHRGRVPIQEIYILIMLKIF